MMMQHLRTLGLGIVLLALLLGVATTAQDDTPIYAETVTVQAAWLDELLADRDNLVVYIALVLGAAIIGVATFDYLRARTLAKTDEERNKALETFTSRLISALEDSNTRNATERKIMAEEMLPVRTVLELVESSTRIVGNATENAILKAISGFLEDVTETTEGEDLGVRFSTSNDEPEAPPQPGLG